MEEIKEFSTSSLITRTTNDIVEKYLYNVKNQLVEIVGEKENKYFTYDKQGNTIK